MQALECGGGRGPGFDATWFGGEGFLWCVCVGGSGMQEKEMEKEMDLEAGKCCLMFL